MWTMLAGVPGKLKTLLDRLTSTRAANLDNLNATISSRAAASTAVSNAVLTDVRIAKLDSPILSTGVVKSVQTGYVTGSMSSGTGGSEDNKYYDVTITAVDTAKCFTFFAGGASSSQDNAIMKSSTSVATIAEVLPRLTSTTNLRLASPRLGTTTHITGRYYVIEFY